MSLDKPDPAGWIDEKLRQEGVQKVQREQHRNKVIAAVKRLENAVQQLTKEQKLLEKCQQDVHQAQYDLDHLLGH